MAEHNFALEIDPPDDSLSLDEYDVETGIRSSRSHLIHKFEEETPASSAAASIKKSIRSSIRKTKYYCDPVVKAVKYILNKSKLLIVISIYSIFGAWLFTTLEVPTDLKLKEEQYHARLIAREVMILNLRAIYYSQKEDREERWKDAIKQFENDLSLDEPSLETDWTFWMAFLYAGTIYTTIGYGNIACKTNAGQVATLLYAFVGIPIMIIILNDLGDFLLHSLEWLANTTSDSILFLGVRWGVITLEEDSKRRKRFLAFRSKLVKNKIISSTSITSIETKSQTDCQSTALTHKTNPTNEDVLPDPPVFSAIVVTFGWIFLAARVFCIWEDWSYFTSIYFFFISCSTIGLGDVTPAHPEYMILAFGVVMVGLSLVTVCINVVQAKLELMYMELLQKILKDYIAAMESGDANAAQDMMAGFTGGAKFLLPFMSKNQGAKVMTQFKEECEAQGIEPPAVLVDINPNTGKPAFVSAPKDEYKDYIEHADEKRQEEKKVEETRLLSKLPQLEDGPRRMFTTSTFGTQTHSVNIVEYVEKASYGLQASPEYSDEEIQTSDCESVDEGIQTWPSLESISVQHDGVKTVNSFSQCDIIEEKPPTKDTGIQPEVSSIYFIDEDYASDSSLSLFDPDNDLFDIEENEDSEKTPDHLSVAIAHSQLLQKSISVESQETVIHVTPTGSPTTSRKTAIEKRKAKKEEKRKQQELRREARLLKKNLRYLKCSGSQTSYDREDCGSQAFVTTASSACQYDKASTSSTSVQNVAETRGRRCQTKLTCIKSSGDQQPNNSKKKIVKRRRIIDSEERQSRTSSTDAIESVSSYEGHGLRLLSTDLSGMASSESQVSSPLIRISSEINEGSQPGRESYVELLTHELSPTDSSKESEAGRTAEVSLNVNLINRAVDESGEYLDNFDDELDDNVFESDDDIVPEDLEQFSLTISTQTEAFSNEADIQTDDYKFEDKLDEIRKEIEKDLRPIIHQELLAEVLENAVVTAECSIQTNSSSFYAIPQIGLETINESAEDRSSGSCSPEPQKCNFLADSMCQTTVNPCHSTVSQTDSVEIIDFRPPVGNMDMQTSFDVTDEECQTVKTEKFEEETQTGREEADGETQTVETTVSECFSQTDLLLSDKSQTVQTIISSIGDHLPVSTQTCLVVSDMDSQTIVLETDQSETQTVLSSLGNLEDIETQTVYSVLGDLLDTESQTLMTSINNSDDVEVQTTQPSTDTDSTQTIVIALLEKDIQTELYQLEQKTIQAENEGETRCQSVDATPSLKTATVQPDVTMFPMNEEDSWRQEDELAEIRFNVERGTSMEDKTQKSVESQCKILETECVGIQVMPSVTTSHTQHTLCLTDDFTQTDIYTKSKSSQGIMAVCETLEQEVEAKTEHKDKMLDCDDLNELMISDEPLKSTSNLWSDFDRIPENESDPNALDKLDTECQTDLDKKQIEKLISLQILSSMENDERERVTKEKVKKKKATVKTMVDAFETKAHSLKSGDSELESLDGSKKDETMSKRLSTTSRDDSSNYDDQLKFRKHSRNSLNDDLNLDSEVFISEEEEDYVDVLENSPEQFELVERDGRIVRRRIKQRHSATTSESKRNDRLSSENSLGSDNLRSYNSLSAEDVVSQEHDQNKLRKRKNQHNSEKKENEVRNRKIRKCDIGTQASFEEGTQLRSAATSPIAFGTFENLELVDSSIRMNAAATGMISSSAEMSVTSTDITTTPTNSNSSTVVTAIPSDLTTVLTQKAASLEKKKSTKASKLTGKAEYGLEDFTEDKKESGTSVKKKLVRKKKAPVKPEVEEAEVQAVVDTRSLGIGQDGKEDWKEVYLAELDLERRQRMLDIGIQTGVLARVQHIYGKNDRDSTESEKSMSEFPKVNLRKTESSEYVRSQESLARTNSVLSIAESLGGAESSPGPSRPLSRTSSFKKPRKSRDSYQETREQTVANLRSKFEDSERRPRRPRSSSNER